MPDSVEDAASLITFYKKIRAVGGGHSFSNIVPTHLLISAKQFKSMKLLPELGEVEVGSGVTLRELNGYLAKNGFAIPTMGEIDEQTVAGLIATATKGTGIQFGSFSDEESFLGVTLIDGAGKVRKIDFADPKQAEIVPALRTALGAFGFVVSVRLKVCPTFKLKEIVKLSTLEEAMRPEHYKDNYRYAFYYYPHSKVSVLRLQNKTNETISLEKRKQRKKNNVWMENFFANAMLDVAAIAPGTIPQVEKLFVSKLKGDVYVDQWNEVMTSVRSMKYFEMQYSVPIENLPAAMQACLRVTEQFAEQGKYYVDLPFFVRFTRGDRGTLIAPSQQQTGDRTEIFAHIDINAHHAQMGYEDFFRAVEAALLPFGAKPHWGKLFYWEPAREYPNAVKFEKLRKQFDPEDKFQNAFIKKHFSDIF